MAEGVRDRTLLLEKFAVVSEVVHFDVSEGEFSREPKAEFKNEPSQSNFHSHYRMYELRTRLLQTPHVIKQLPAVGFW